MFAKIFSTMKKFCQCLLGMVMITSPRTPCASKQRPARRTQSVQIIALVAGACFLAAALAARESWQRRTVSLEPASPPGESPVSLEIPESDANFQKPQHAQQRRREPHPGLQFSDQPVEPFQKSDVHAAKVARLPWYTSASQQDEKWGGVHQSNTLPNAVQNAYLYAQHVAQSHTGQLLRWRNYVTQRRSDATPDEQLAQAKGMSQVATTEYNQALAQLAALRKMAVIRRLDLKRQQKSQRVNDVNKFATGMLRNEDLAQVKQDEAFGKIASATKILNRMTRSGLLHRNAAAERLRHLQQLPYVMTQVAQNDSPASPTRRGYASNGYETLPAYGGPAVTDCGPEGSSSSPDTVCNGVPTTMAAKMLRTRLQVDEASINAISLNINRLQHLESKLFARRARQEYKMQVNASKGLPIVVAR